jgi:formylglycine-generating enzyme required for sulfatase activity
MHGEALAWLRAALAYAPPRGATLPRLPRAIPCASTAAACSSARPAAARLRVRQRIPGREVVLAPYEIDATPVTAGEFLRFVEAGGYPTTPGGAARRARGGPRTRCRIRLAGAAATPAGRRAGSTAGSRSIPNSR